MSKCKVYFMSGLIALLGAGQVLSGTIAFDSFPIGAGAYTNNVGLVGQGPTNSPIVGFTGMWTGNTSVAQSSAATVDAPNIQESDGSLRFVGAYDTVRRWVYRYFTEQPCLDGDTNYWSAVVTLDGQDANDIAYVKWRDMSNTFMAIELGIMNGRLYAGLREQLYMDLGSYIPGRVYHLVARAVISGGGRGLEDTTVWVNPTLSDIIHDRNIATNCNTISFISPGVDHDRVEVLTQNIGGSTAYFDELLYTTDIDDLNFTLPKIQSATFTPMPRPDDSGSYNHKITHDFDLKSITLGSSRYTDIEGPTNAWVTGGSAIAAYPIKGETVTPDEALVGLRINAAANITTAEVAFATTLTSSFSGGFFLLEANGDDFDIIIRPLDANRNLIGNWSLTLSGSGSAGSYSSCWSGNLTGEGETALDVRFNTASIKINGLAFTLDDFTGGSGVLDNVHGLQFVDASSSFDPVMVGIYRGPADAPLSSGSTSPMIGATFNRAFPDNPITNDFEITGISSAVRSWTSVEGAVKANLHLPGVLKRVYPKNGVAPATTENYLEGLKVNGILGTGYYMELMFATPVTDSGDRIFIIDDARDNDQITIRPLDADRFPISTHSIEVSSGDWGASLTPYTITYQPWGGAQTGREIAGVLFGLSDFAGGTGTVDNVWGIRIENYNGDIDLMMAGRTRDTGTLILIY